MNEEEVSVEERGGSFHATTRAGKYEVSVVYNPKAFPPVTEAAFFVGNKAEEIIKLEADGLGNDAETIKSSLEEAALKFRDLIERGFYPAQIEEEMRKEKTNED